MKLYRRCTRRRANVHVGSVNHALSCGYFSQVVNNMHNSFGELLFR